jgi:hypothetical protein
MIYTDFVFSGMRDNYFHNMKTLIKPLFEFDYNVNTSSLTDLLLAQKEDVGTVIKNEDDEETKNPEVDLFAVFSMVPITYYLNGKGVDSESVSKQIFETLKSKIDKYAESDNDRATATDILKGSRVGLLVSERMMNLPQEAIPICMDFLIKEIGECREEEAYDGKYDMDYVIVMSKFVKRIVSNDFKKIKKTKPDNNVQSSEEILHYKFETEHYLKKAVVNISYKIPYEQMNMEYLENKNEPQYFSIMFLKTKDFVDIAKYLNNNK